nr:crumbs-like protein 3b [Danio rerio]
MLSSGVVLTGHAFETRMFSDCLFAVSIMSSGSVSDLYMPALFLLVLALALFSCVLRKKRQMEGSYQPSAEERKQVKNRGVEKPGLALPLPKEERLI